MVQQTGAGRRAEIAGAGIGGLTAAAALAQRGWSVTVHERAPTLRTFGAGIYIWSNGLRVLKAIGAYDQATVGAHIGPVFHTRDHHDATMEEIPINGPGGARLITILRETLINSLVETCRRSGVEILTNSEVTGATPDGELLLADGAKRKADLVVGADGVNSRVRDSLDLLMYRKQLGYGAIRMLIARDDSDVRPEDRDRYIEYFTGTRRILYTPASSTDLYVALCCASDDKQALQVPADRALWTDSFPHLASLVARFGDAGRWDEFEVIKLKAWSKGRVAILGDAAHAMPPYLGQGGGCALMNGIGLAATVAGAPDVAKALVDWEARERPMTEHTQDTAECLGDMNFWPDDVRSQVLKITGQCREIAMERMKTALHAPTATEAL
ncbi:MULTISPECIES: NAD(P)/FAD-dependent oxidoreductase [unclassified Beijerinckia]|uniref:FAD-dependent oxidoreductase n=1 Tax=unclassified Beijerinckia TaxID=2638183 RepID=UPI000895F7F9|nr:MULTISPECIES: NAD(P)/FAD-dependent oxidoreductase [unclassified Beijerinckia]MDH7799331.1 2-polyprenyl-6-methoxyphenol hydroxylase-like FAD-dependent oxidoreductase [Beijerinckia sp. GAS462]SED46515.1 2-polyprenyl-6-methoxyphenol hydroxylase [Beijerinckia sp. 28-YEA-48]